MSMAYEDVLGKNANNNYNRNFPIIVYFRNKVNYQIPSMK